MKIYFGIVVKTVVVTGLTAVFFIYFCVPSYQNYTELQTFLAESSKHYEQEMLPAVSVCSQEEDTDLLYHDIQDSCYQKEDYSQILSCVEQFTTNLSSLVKQVGIEDSPITFNVSDRWIPSYGIIMKGRVFTLNNSFSLSDKFYTYFTFKSSPGASVQIQIHDPRFFLDHSEKLKDFPAVRLELRKGKKYTLNLDIVEYQILDTEKRRCQQDRSYSFRACIQNYLLETVGCLGPWRGGIEHSSCKTGKVEMSG